MSVRPRDRFLTFRREISNASIVVELLLKLLSNATMLWLEQMAVVMILGILSLLAENVILANARRM